MDWEKIFDALKSAAMQPEWWSAAGSVLGLLVAILAFFAAWRAARAAVNAYRAQVNQLAEMEAQTVAMRDQVTEAAKQTMDARLYGISIWLSSPHPGDARADICYVNTTGHPVYNVSLEITDISDKFISIPVLEPTTQPRVIERATEFFRDELAFIGDLRRPGIAFQFDTSDGDRFERDHGGNLLSAGGNPLARRPHRKWLPEYLRS